MYQSIKAGIVEQHCRRVIWRGCDTNKEFETYVLSTVTYGDVCAGYITTSALRLTAEMFKSVNEDAASKLINDIYVDDVTTGADDRPKVEMLKECMEEIAQEGGFKFTGWTVSGDKGNVEIQSARDFPKVLGCYWNTGDDSWRFVVKVNYFGKYKGAHKGPDLDKDEIPLCLPEHLTKRILFRLVNTVYDPMGLLVPFTLKLKLQMRKLFLTDATKNLDWDSPIPPEMRNCWVQLLIEMYKVEEIKFPRSIKPVDDVKTENPVLVTFSDGSCDGFCAVTYIQWKLDDGSYKAFLVSAKSRVGPINKISVQRMELQGALINCRLHNSIKGSLGIKFERELHVIDSGAVKDMITRESSSCKEFVGTRVGEIRLKTSINDWAWVQSKDNPADLGTHGVDPLKLGRESVWQCGPEWMKLHYSYWPIDFDYKDSMPIGELIQVHEINIVNSSHHIGNVIDIKRFNSLNKLLRVTSIVQRVVKDRKFKMSPLTPTDLEAAEKSWEADAQ